MAETEVTEPLATDATLSNGIDRMSTALEIIAGRYSGPEDLTYSRIAALVRAGYAKSTFKIGDQILTKLQGNDQECDFFWDVVHHFDGSDDDHPLVTLKNGDKVPGMMLQAHRTVPWAIIWEPQQAFLAVTGDMPAGAYTFIVDVGVVWGTGVAAAVGKKSYTFTTTQPLTAGAQMVWNASYSAALTGATVYKAKASTETVETITISEGSTGTALGTIGDQESTNSVAYCILNNIERSCGGSNRWSTSQARVALNATDTITQGGTAFSRPWGLVGKRGLLGCLPTDFVAVLGEVKRSQELHSWDGGSIETTYDRVFPISAREHAFSNYLSETDAGYKANGGPLDYWSQLCKFNGHSAWSGWQMYPELITFDAKATTTARNVWLSSARRDRSTACSVGCVYSSGGVSSAYANYGYYAAPAVVIV